MVSASYRSSFAYSSGSHTPEGAAHRYGQDAHGVFRGRAGPVEVIRATCAAPPTRGLFGRTTLEPLVGQVAELMDRLTSSPSASATWMIVTSAGYD